jgi:hypothetical protein
MLKEDVVLQLQVDRTPQSTKRVAALSQNCKAWLDRHGEASGEENRKDHRAARRNVKVGRAAGGASHWGKRWQPCGCMSAP